MSDVKEAHAIIIAVFEVDDPEAYAERQLAKGGDEPDEGETEDMPASMKLVRRRALQMPDVAGELRVGAKEPGKDLYFETSGELRVGAKQPGKDLYIGTSGELRVGAKEVGKDLYIDTSGQAKPGGMPKMVWG